MRLLVSVLISFLTLHAQTPRLADVQERRLANGVRLLLVERRGLAAFHATLVFRGGWAEEPAPAAGGMDLLARALYGTTWPEDVDPAKTQPGLEALLKQEEGLLEALRLERLRQRQRQDPANASALPALESHLESVQGRLRALFSLSPLADLYTARGGRQTAEATADALQAHTELPQEAFEFWCRTEAQRLRSIQLSRFSQARTALVTELRAQGAQGVALLRGAALPGHPYGRDLADHLPSLEALRWSDLRALARRTLRPDHLMVIIIGGLSLDSALPTLERHLGSLPAPPEGEDALLPEIPADLGDRRVQATLGGSPSLLCGWRLPARRHPDHLPLRLAAQLLGGGRTARLESRLVRQKAMAQQVDLRMDLPGGRLPGLLMIGLKPADGHSLAEVEGALHSEILRLHQDPIPQDEWLRAIAQLEADHVRMLDEPAALARALGQAWAEGGDWRLLESDAQRLRTLTPESVQAAVRDWLKPTHRTTVMLEPTPDGPLNPLETEMSRVLNALAAHRIQDPAQRERLVSEGLRQLRMLNPEERQRTLKLLEAQLTPERR
ncbi:MAG: insulinase family protein [Geothrix sp.]|uniref:M16 family metallopeptidase n=1 Tax=Geothrix sp. TaxID=1962974 RepID=UPI0017F52147|nr:insulinase family protein [Geothrix sp.]NWJ41788.1 insulinase family protein [Geothrix sp.]WIL20234.1 MAG: insulinase family protein [Geothrix sp.]